MILYDPPRVTLDSKIGQEGRWYKVKNVIAVYHLLHHIHYNENRKRANLCHTRQHAIGGFLSRRWYNH